VGDGKVGLEQFASAQHDLEKALPQNNNNIIISDTDMCFFICEGRKAVSGVFFSGKGSFC
jgi:hypothetical protein